MILHCTPPYREQVPNPALGYLSGFLQTNGIDVRTIHWNLILARKLLLYRKKLEKYEKCTRHFPVFHTVYMIRQLLMEDSGSESQTPLDLFYLSVYSKKEISEMAQSLKDDIDLYIFKNKLHEDSIAGFTLNFFQWLMSLYLIRRLKKLNPEIKVLIGGITSLSQGIHFLRMFNQADFAVYGEGEYPLLYLTRALEDNRDPNSVPNLIYRDRNRILSTEVFRKYPPLDEYPFADHSDYFSILKECSVPLLPIIPIWGSRSCWWNKCKFCVDNLGLAYRTRSPENIVKEIEYQSRKHGIDSYIFVDSEVAGTMKRFKNLLKLLIESSMTQKKRYSFTGEVSPLFINPKTAKQMQLASFREIQIGFEAMTDSLLEKMLKKHRFAHNIQAIKLANQHGLNIRGLNILRGIPTETRADILESCLNIKFLRFFVNKYPLNPGFLKLWKYAPFYDDLSEEDRRMWEKNRYWTEIEPLTLISDSDKYEFFGFYSFGHDRLWDDFEDLLNFYVQQDHSYEWIEYPDGSFLEEKALRFHKYRFDRDETDLLIFCDSIRTFSEVKERFPHLSMDDLRDMLASMKDAGLIYSDKDLNMIISVLEAGKREVLSM
jgi:radical SAM superfamily enzyme YgiQ (UPF0313 family)